MGVRVLDDFVLVAKVWQSIRVGLKPERSSVDPWPGTC